MAQTEGRSRVQSGSGNDDLDGFLGGTQRRAYSLAFRITGDVKLAEAATEAAYGRLEPPFREGELFDVVRQEALQRAPRRSDAAFDSYQLAAAVRAGFESLGQVQRSALELAYSGGMTVAAIAEALREEPTAIREGLREALLGLGAIAQEGKQS